MIGRTEFVLTNHCAKFNAGANQKRDDARWPIITALAQHGEDVEDHNIPKMIWFGLEPLVVEDPDRAIELAASTRIPLLAQHISRRLTDAEEFDIFQPPLMSQFADLGKPPPVRFVEYHRRSAAAGLQTHLTTSAAEIQKRTLLKRRPKHVENGLLEHRRGQAHRALAGAEGDGSTLE